MPAVISKSRSGSVALSPPPIQIRQTDITENWGPAQGSPRSALENSCPFMLQLGVRGCPSLATIWLPLSRGFVTGTLCSVS